MRIAVEIALSDDDVTHLNKLSKSRSVSVRLAERSRIILLAGTGMTCEGRISPIQLKNFVSGSSGKFLASMTRFVLTDMMGYLYMRFESHFRKISISARTGKAAIATAIAPATGRRPTGIDPGKEPVPDMTTIPNFSIYFRLS